MARGWPPLTWREIVDCLVALGWVYDRTESSHVVYVHPPTGRAVPVDTNWNPAGSPLMSHFVKYEVAVKRETFYRATKATARKIR